MSKERGMWLSESAGNLKGLSLTQKLLLSTIERFQKEEGECFASNQFFADTLDLDVLTISRALSKLKAVGCIEQTGFNGRERKLSLTDAYKNNPEQTIRQGIQNVKSALTKRQCRLYETSMQTIRNVNADYTKRQVCPDETSSLPYKGINKSLKREEKEINKSIILPMADATADNPILTYPDKIQNTKEEKSPAAKKEESSLHAKCKQIYLDQREGYYWTGIDGSSLNDLLKKIKHTYRTTAKRDPSDEEVAKAFGAVIAHPVEWMVTHKKRDLKDYNSQYNSIIDTLKDGKPTAKAGNKPHYQQQQAELGLYAQHLGAIISG